MKSPPLLKNYLGQLLAHAKAKVPVSFVLSVLLGLTQGISLVMIIPFLHTLGVSGGGGTGGGFTRTVSGLFQALGLSFNLYTLLGAYILLVSLFAFLRRYQSILDVQIQQGFVCFLRNRLYRTLTYADWLFIAREKSSHITHTLTADIQRVGQGTFLFMQFTGSIAMVLFNLAAAFLLSVTLTGAALAFGLFMFIFLKPLSRAAFDTGKAARKLKRGLLGSVMEHLTGMKTAKSFGVESRHIERIETVNAGIAAEAVQYSRVRANTRMFYEIMGVIFLSGFLVAAVHVFHVPTPRLLVLGLIFTRLMPRFANLHQQYQGIKNMLPAFSGVEDLYSRARQAPGDEIADKQKKQKIPAEPVRLEQGIAFSRVSFRYSAGNDAYALQDFSAHIPAHKITAVTGPSGSGKSTLADLLLGLLKPERGTITADRVDISGERLHDWRNSIGYVPQESFLFHDTVRANLLWARPGASEDQLWEALRMAAAYDFVKAMPRGLDTVAGDRGLAVSGGERQRLALARALLKKPRLLLMDEATSALDPENEQRIMNALQSLRTGLTVVIVAHRESTVKWADHVIRLTNR